MYLNIFPNLNPLTISVSTPRSTSTCSSAFKAIAPYQNSSKSWCLWYYDSLSSTSVIIFICRNPYIWNHLDLLQPQPSEPSQFASPANLVRHPVAPTALENLLPPAAVGWRGTERHGAKSAGSARWVKRRWTLQGAKQPTPSKGEPSVHGENQKWIQIQRRQKKMWCPWEAVVGCLQEVFRT